MRTQLCGALCCLVLVACQSETESTALGVLERDRI